VIRFDGVIGLNLGKNNYRNDKQGQ